MESCVRVPSRDFGCPIEGAENREATFPTYDGANDTLLAERDGIVIGRSSLRRLLCSAGRPSPRHRRAPRHRSRRDRMPQAGLFVQLDGSRHD